MAAGASSVGGIGPSPNTPRMSPMSSATTIHPATAIQIPSTTQRIRLRRRRGAPPVAPGAWRGRSSTVWEDAGIRLRLYRRARGRSSIAERGVGGALALLALAATLLVAGAAAAQSPVEPARTGVRIDFPRGPVIASSRITGLAGAFTGVAEGIDGALKNPASLANRPEHATSWFDVDVALDLLNTTGDAIDFDADGVPGAAGASFQAVNLGLALQFGGFAIGVLAAVDTWSGGKDATALDADLLDVIVGVAQAFAGGEVIVGAGLNVRAFTLTEQGGASVDLASETYDFGVLWRPRALPWRIGAQVRLGGVLSPRGDPAWTLSPGHEVRDAVAPWQLGLGVSHRWAADPERSYNAPLRKASPAKDRRYLLLTADVVISGPSPGAVNFEGFVSGAPRRAGVTPTASFHLGAEGEVLHDRLRARVGTYLEPIRASNGGFGRLHMTGGAELHLFELGPLDFKASFAFDMSVGFNNILFGVGLWN